MLEKYYNKKIVLAGFGVEGRATYDFLTSSGIVVDIADRMEEQEFFVRNPEMQGEKANFHFGPDYLNNLKDYDVVFRSPGISPMTPEIQSLVKAGKEVTSQIQLFFELARGKVIGVTGTKGKGTTSTLIYEILKSSGKDAYLGGNIGTPAISFAKDLSDKSITVLELSSFQLMDLSVSPDIGVVLNITSDHLDYHQDVTEYRRAKEAIVKYQTDNDWAVINDDYETSRRFASLTKGKVARFSVKHPLTEGAFVDQEERLRIVFPGINEEIARTDEVKLRGRHNLENIEAACCAAYLAGASLESLRKTVKDFKGLEHRLELVAQKGALAFYNDSFSTNPETTIAALAAFDKVEPVALIAGGSSKGARFEEMAKTIVDRASGAVLMGDTAGEIEAAIRKFDQNLPIAVVQNMKEAVDKAVEILDSRGVVLLSPGCASFGLFENYKDRGKQFKDAAVSVQII